LSNGNDWRVNAENTFLGTGWSFPPTFHRSTGSVRMVSDEEDIRQSILLFLGTHQGERDMRPEYGSPLFQHVFDLASGRNIDWILQDLGLALRINEPRIFVHSITAGQEKILEGILHLRIDYEIESTNVRNNIVYPFYLAEGTKIT